MTKITMAWYAFRWLLLAVFMAAGIGSLNIPKLMSMIANQRVTEAVIDSVACHDHGNVTYSFKAGGLAYHGKAAPNADCSDVRPGDRVIVYYNYISPSANMLIDPGAALKNEIQSIVVACILGPPFMMWAWKKAMTPR